MCPWRPGEGRKSPGVQISRWSTQHGDGNELTFSEKAVCSEPSLQFWSYFYLYPLLLRGTHLQGKDPCPSAVWNVLNHGSSSVSFLHALSPPVRVPVCQALSPHLLCLLNLHLSPLISSVLSWVSASNLNRCLDPAALLMNLSAEVWIPVAHGSFLGVYRSSVRNTRSLLGSVSPHDQFCSCFYYFTHSSFIAFSRYFCLELLILLAQIFGTTILLFVIPAEWPR